jgi:hypothetical protein
MGTSEVGNDAFRCILSDAGMILSNHDANLLFHRVRGPSGHTRINVLLLIHAAFLLLFHETHTKIAKHVAVEGIQ